MTQIIINYLFIFAAPFLIGAAARFLFRHEKRAYLITLAFTALAVVGWVVFYTVPSYGSEIYCILALLATSTAVGAMLIGLIIQLKRYRKLPT